MSYTNIPKPTGTTYTNVDVQGKHSYDDAELIYDDSNTFYDGINPNMYTNIAKPSSTSYTNIPKPV